MRRALARRIRRGRASARENAGEHLLHAVHLRFDRRCLDAAALPPQRPGNFELELCNANALDILLTLGLEPSHGDVLPIDIFSNLVTVALRRHLGKRSPELPAVEDAKSRRMTIIHVGRAEGYIERRLGALAHAIQRSRQIDATHFGWG